MPTNLTPFTVRARLRAADNGEAIVVLAPNRKAAHTIAAERVRIRLGLPTSVTVHTIIEKG